MSPFEWGRVTLAEQRSGGLAAALPIPEVLESGDAPARCLTLPEGNLCVLTTFFLLRRYCLAS